MERELFQPHGWAVLPFVVLLATIALAPLLAPAWWLKHYAKVAFALGAVVLGYYGFGQAFGFNERQIDLARTQVLHTGLEYFSFITLIGSLYVVSGGIHISVKGEATPLANVAFLLIGALLANVLGTTGASMLLIRPWLRMNKYRLTAHHVVFFIFLVSNVGGCLTPIGDPPLFLGYLLGVPFWWVATHGWRIWATGVGALLVMFFVVDYRNYLRAPKAVRDKLAAPADHWRFEGLSNVFLLGIILAAVFIHRPPLLREALMVLAAIASYVTTRPSIHQANDFNFHPIREVAVLFIGIFATMMPALNWLEAHAGSLGSAGPGWFYWASGSLSSVLDNAPTYRAFLSMIFGACVSPEIVSQVKLHLAAHGADLTALAPDAVTVRQTLLALQQYHPAQVAAGNCSTEAIEIACLIGNPRASAFLLAISVGAVFFGANTYIGNGPNFMVKAIADQQKAHTPSFLGYVFKYSLPYMGAMLLLIWWLFFRQ